MKEKFRISSIFVRYRSSIIIIFLMIPSFAVSADSLLTLSDCLNLAFEKNKSLKIAKISMNQADEKIGEAVAQRYPAATLNGIYTHVGKVTSFTIPMGAAERTFKFGTSNRINFDAKIQLPLFTWGRISNSIQISKIGKTLSSTQHRQQKLNVTHQVLQAYYSLLLNEVVIHQQEKNLERAQKLAEIAKSRFSAGGVPQLEVLRTEVQLENSQTALEESRGNYKNSQLFLANTLGINNWNVQVKGSFVSQPVEFDVRNIIERALENRTDLHSVRLQQQISRSRITIASSGNKPSLFMFSGYNVQNGFDPMDPERFVDNWNIGFQISFPIFDGFAASHKTEQAKLDVRKAELQEEQIQELIALQVRQAATSLLQAEKKIASQKRSIKLARESLDTAEDQFRLGIVSSLDVLNAQQTLFQSESMYNQALFNHIMAKLELSRAMADYSWFGSVLAED